MQRWLPLGACAIAIAAVSYGMFTPWLDLPENSRLGIEPGIVEQVPGWAWVFEAITIAGIAFALFRRGAPRAAALVLAGTGVVGAAAMLWTIRLLGRSVAANAFGDRIDVVIAPGAWIVVAGFAASTLAGLWLWRAAKPAA